MTPPSGDECKCKSIFFLLNFRMEFTEDELSDGAQMVVEVLGVLNPRQPEPNPWSVDSVSQFLHYCCPECPAKTRDLKAFVKHAKSYHEKVSSIFKAIPYY